MTTTNTKESYEQSAAWVASKDPQALLTKTHFVYAIMRRRGIAHTPKNIRTYWTKCTKAILGHIDKKEA